MAAARTPVGAFNGALATVPAHELGAVAIKEALRARQDRRGRGSGRRAGPSADRGCGAEPGAAGRGQGRHPDRADRPHHQPSLRGLGPVCGGDRIPGGDQGRRRCCWRWPAGRRASAGRRTARTCGAGPRWAARAGRHHDQGRPVGAINGYQGHHGRRQNAARKWQITREQQLPRSRPAASRRRKRRRRPAGSGTRSSPSRSRPGKGDVPVDRTATSTPSTAPRPRPWSAAPGVQQGRHGHGRQRLGSNDGASVVVLMAAEDAARRGFEPLARIAGLTAVWIP